MFLDGSWRRHHALLDEGGRLSQEIASLIGVTKSLGKGTRAVTAVKGATVSVRRGETVGILGPSGAGKTTLLELIGTLESPDSGQVLFQGQSVLGIGAAKRRELRLSKIGFVFQQLRLIPTLSAVENVELPMALRSIAGATRRKKARDLIQAVGLQGKEDRRPGALSVGEQQRVAVARAMANDPVLVLADEPTSHLDSEAGAKVVGLLTSMSTSAGAAVLISTHDPRMCEGLMRVCSMRDGVLTVPEP